jgi:AcrR family transcriptional regulator
MSRKIIAPQRREQIVRALFDCLADKGHESITVKDIARRANLHYGVIHYYFKSKDDIVSAVADSIITKYERLLLERIQPIHSASEKLQVAIDFLMDEFIFNRRLNRVFYNLVQMAYERKTVRIALQKQLKAYRGHIAEVVSEGIQSGQFARRDTAQTALLMVALVEGMALQWVINPKSLRRADVRKIIEDTIGSQLNNSSKRTRVRMNGQPSGKFLVKGGKIV